MKYNKPNPISWLDGLRIGTDKKKDVYYHKIKKTFFHNFKTYKITYFNKLGKRSIKPLQKRVFMKPLYKRRQYKKLEKISNYHNHNHFMPHKNVVIEIISPTKYSVKFNYFDQYKKRKRR